MRGGRPGEADLRVPRGFSRSEPERRGKFGRGRPGPAVLLFSSGQEARERIRSLQVNRPGRRLSRVCRDMGVRGNPGGFSVLDSSFPAALGTLMLTASSEFSKAGLCLPEQTGLFLRWEGCSVVNLNSSAFMKRRTVQPVALPGAPTSVVKAATSQPRSWAWGDEYQLGLGSPFTACKTNIVVGHFLK